MNGLLQMQSLSWCLLSASPKLPDATCIMSENEEKQYFFNKQIFQQTNQ